MRRTTSKTTKNILGDGYTTRTDASKTYKTTRNVLDDGYTTYGSDGSTYKTHRSALGDGYTTSQVSGPAGSVSNVGVGGGIGALVAGVLIAICCGSVLSMASYAFMGAAAFSFLLAGVCERFKVSKLWFAGTMLGWAMLSLVASVGQDVAAVAGTDRSGEGAMILCALALFIILTLAMMPFTLESATGNSLAIASFFTMIVALPWSFFNVIYPIPHTAEMTPIALGALALLALVHQMALSAKSIQ